VNAGDAQFIARAHHAGDLIPGKYLPGQHCFISYGGQEIAKDEFEVLMNTGFKWIQAGDGFVPENAVVGGRSLSGEKLFVGRGKHGDLKVPGKICKQSKCIYVPFGGEFSHKEYEVLVQILQPQTQSPGRSSGECDKTFKN
jgi:hypothetical protein